METFVSSIHPQSQLSSALVLLSSHNIKSEDSTESPKESSFITMLGQAISAT